MRALSCRGRTVLVAMVMLVGWVSFTRPFSVFFSILNSRQSLTAAATARSEVRGENARKYFERLQPKTAKQPLSHGERHIQQDFGDSNLQGHHQQGGDDNFSYQNHDVNSDVSRTYGVKFVIAIITARRPAPDDHGDSVGDMDYLLQSAAPLHQMTENAKEFNDSVLFVCNVDRAPESHSHAVFLKDYLHYAERFGTSSFNTSLKTSLNFSLLHRFQRDVGRFQKERHDYMYCMQAAMNFDPQYVLMVEDDAVPHPDLPTVLEDVLRRITNRRKSTVCIGNTEYSISPCSSDPRNSSLDDLHGAQNVTSTFAFLKLFLPEKWRGFYLFDPLRLIDLLCVGVTGAAVYLLLVYISLPRQSRFQPTWGTFLTGVLLSLFVAWLVGRQNLNELRRVSKHLYRVEPSPGCCTPAILYPADVIKPLLTWLVKSPTTMPVDMRIDGIAKALGLPAFCVEPVLFRHIGMVSTLGHQSQHPEEFLLV